MNKMTQIAVTALFAAGAAQAAVITWAPSVDLYPGTTTEAFVQTNGLFVAGFNGTTNTTGSVSVNGIEFNNANAAMLNAGITQNGVTIKTSTTMGQTSNAYGDGGFYGNTDIFNLIASGLFGATTVTLSGLTSGQQYQLQIFCNDARTSGSRSQNFQTGFSDGVNTFADSRVAGTWGTAHLNNRVATNLVGETSGDYIIGTFTADGTTQSFEINGTSTAWVTTGSSQAQLNALQLSAIPEPATLGLVVAIGGGVLFIRRRFMM